MYRMYVYSRLLTAVS